VRGSERLIHFERRKALVKKEMIHWMTLTGTWTTAVRERRTIAWGSEREGWRDPEGREEREGGKEEGREGRRL